MTTNGAHPDHASETATGTMTTDETLRRILAAVQQDKRRGRLEVALAILLSLATLASTWCGYQANKWGGLQSSQQAAADTAERKAAEDTLAGLQLRTFDGISMLEFWRAMRTGDDPTREAIHARMRPALRTAVDAAIAAGAPGDPNAAGPLQRPEYLLPQEQDAKQQRETAHAAQRDAREAGQAAGSYVLLTLAFATVLFFGGITATFTRRPVRVALACVAATLFLVAMASLVQLPVFGA